MGRHSITLDNFADFHGEVNGVEITSILPLEPYVPSDEIAIDLGRVSRAARFGHLNSLTFRRYTEQFTVTPGVDSMSEEGSATASFSATNAGTSPRGDSSVDPKKTFVFDKGSGTVKINLGHEDLNDVNLREAKPWASYLDTAISEGLRSSSNRKLLGATLDDRVWRVIFAASNLLKPVLDLKSHGLSKAASTYANDILWYNIMIGLVGSFKTGGELSLTPGFSLDRLGLVQAYTQTRKFVKTT